MKPIILASTSPRRKELMPYVGWPFVVVHLEVEESLTHTQSGLQAAYDNATLKAKAAASHYPNQWILACDTVVAFNQTLLGKPIDDHDAIAMLELLSGRTHDVISACVLISPTQEVMQLHDLAKVEFYPLKRDEIEAYVSSKEPFGKAGAYAIQGEAIKFVKKIEGDYASIMGLPVAKLYRFFKAQLG